MLKKSLVGRNKKPLNEDYQYRSHVRKAVTGTRSASANESFFNAKGEMNASSRKDAIEKLASLLDEVKDGGISMQTTADDGEQQRMSELVQAAMEDRMQTPNGPFCVLGETLSDVLYETTGRLGWGRKIYAKQDVEKGKEGRFRIRQKNVVSHIITKDEYVPRCVVNQPYLYPPVITLAANLTISDNEEAMAPLEFMDEKFQDGLEAILVREDNYIRTLLLAASSVENSVYSFVALTPAIWSNMQLQIVRHGLDVPNAIIANDLWTDIRTSTDFLAVFEPVKQLQLIEEGYIGSLYGTNIITDGYIYPTMKVLNPGEMYFVANPVATGGICDYQALQSEPISLHQIGVSARGWWMHQTSGYINSNARAVCRGYRS